MDLDAAQAAVERACEDFKSPATAAAASSVLLAFRSSPAMLPACRHILDRSPSLDARFHAAAALREGVVREWATLGPDGRTALRSYLLSYLVAHAEDPTLQVVRSSLCSALAVLLKRGWLEMEGQGEGAATATAAAQQHTEFFRELEAATTAPHVVQSPHAAAAARRVGLQVLEAVVGEFSLATASPLGLPLEQHARCAAELQDHFLPDIFRHAVAMGRAAAAAQDGATCATSLSLMAAVLSWDFRRTASPSAFPLTGSRPSSTTTLGAVPRASGGSGGLSSNSYGTTAGADWASLLLSPETLDWVAGLLGQLTAAAAAPGASAAARELVARARGMVVALSSLAPEVFPREGVDVLMGPGGGVRGGYLRVVLRCVVTWLAAPEMVVGAAATEDELPLWEACKALLALAAAHPPRLLQAAGNDVLAAAGGDAGGGVGGGGGAPASGGGFLGLLQALTLEVIRASCSGPQWALEQWVVECRDMLVETWALLVQRDSSNPLMLPLSVGALGPPSLPGLAEGAAAVFGALMEAAMAAAGREAEEDDDEEDVAAENEAAEAEAEDARMAEAAALARAAPAATFPMLAAALATTQQQLLAAAAAGPAGPSAGGGGGGVGSTAWVVSLEQLCWLVRMAAHCLADSGAGETPLMPLPLSLAAEGGGPAVAAVEGLTGALLGLPALALQQGAAAVLSPRLMECTVWSLARWADTYLFPEEGDGLPAALVGAYATRGFGQAESVVDGMARLAATCLVAFPGEMELHSMVCTTLLPVLCRRRPLCAVLLESSPGWRELAAAFAARSPPLVGGLAPKLQRWLSQCLCQAACGYPSPDNPTPTIPAAAVASPPGHYLFSLLGPTATELRALAARPDLASLAARADVVAALCGMLEVLRGGGCRGAAAAGPLARSAAWGLLSELLAPLLGLQRAAGDDPRVGALLLKLAAAVVEHHVGYLQTDQAQLLMGWVLELLRQYRSGRAARVAVAVVAGVAAGDGRHRGQTGGAEAAAAAAAAASRTSAAGTAALHEDAARDASRELRGLLVLLTHITQRDVALAAAASDGWATASSADSTPRSVSMGGGGGPGGNMGGFANNSRGNTPKGPGGGGSGGFGSGGEESGVASVVLTGLEVLLPLLTPELLAAATREGAGAAGGGGTGGKLARLLFGLLAYMMEVHPHAVVSLPPPHFQTLLSCLEAGAKGGFAAAQPSQQPQTAHSHGGTSGNDLQQQQSTTNGQHPSGQQGGGAGSGSGGVEGGAGAMGFDGVVVQSALEGISGLAKYHHQSFLNGGRGFSGQCAPAAAGGGPLGPHLLQLLMGIVLMGDVGPEVVELAGDAVLPLLQADPPAFAQLANALVQSSDPRVSRQVGAALTRLLEADPASTPSLVNTAAAAAAALSGGGERGTLDLSRVSRRAFRERLCGVVAELRGLLRVR